MEGSNRKSSMKKPGAAPTSKSLSPKPKRKVTIQESTDIEGINSLTDEEAQAQILLAEEKGDLKIDKVPISEALKNYINSLPESDREKTELKAHLRQFHERRRNRPLPPKKPKKWKYEIVKISAPKVVSFCVKYSIIWEVVMYFVTMIQFFIISYCAFFTFYDGRLLAISIALDIMFFIDMYMRLFVELWRYKTKCPAILFFLPYTITQYFFDIISTFPIERIVALFIDLNDFHNLYILGILRCNRLFRVFRVFKFFERLEGEKRVNEKLVYLCEFFTKYLIFCHILACLLFVLVGLYPYDWLLERDLDIVKTTWMRDKEEKENYGNSSFDLYSLSAGFSVAIVTTVGYGDITPFTELEMIICIAVMLFSAIFWSGDFSANLTSFELETDSARFDLFYRLKGILYHLRSLNSLEVFNAQVEEYYRLLWNFRAGLSDVPFLKMLPTSTQEDLWQDICQEMFHKSSIFRNLEEPFLRKVAQEIEVVLYNPGMIICELGTFSSQMYYLIQGEVNVRSQLRDQKVAAVVRAGSIIGEANLFFSYPYTNSYETKTSCQFIVLKKENLMDCFKNFPFALEVIRTRMQNRISNIEVFYEMKGRKPLCWLQPRRDPNVVHRTPDEDRPVSIRWGSGFNLKCHSNVFDIVESHVIIEYPCIIEKFKKDHTIPYVNCAIPSIFEVREKWIQVWMYIILILTCFISFTGPYCLGFSKASNFDNYFCELNHRIEIPITLLYTLDVFIEICSSTPVTGIRFRFLDGIRVASGSFIFWVDVFAAIPFNIYQTDEILSFTRVTSVILRSLKIVKIIRYLHYKDNTSPERIFIFRVMETILIIFYGIHYISCILFINACPTVYSDVEDIHSVVCAQNIWMRNYYTAISGNGDGDSSTAKLKDEYNPERLKDRIPYLTAFYYATATLTSAGFGDFNPQTTVEMCWSMFFQIFGFFIIGNYNSILTSALSCTVRPKSGLSSRIANILAFLKSNEARENLTLRLEEHCFLMNELWMGNNIPKEESHLLYDSSEDIEEDSLYMEASYFLEGIPIFTKTDPKIIIKVARKMKRYLLPPGCFLIQKDDCLRTLFIIGKGSVEILKEPTARRSRILEASTHIGLRDMLFGEAHDFYVKTLSYCIIFAIDHDNFSSILELDLDMDEMQILINYEKTLIEPIMEAKWLLKSKQKTALKAPLVNKVRYIHSFNYFTHKKPEGEGSLSEYLEYMKPFEKLSKWNPLKKILYHVTINSQGEFSTFWTCLLSVIATLIFVNSTMETFMWIRAPWFSVIQALLDLVNVLDVYLKLHWAFFLSNGLRVIHPVQTALHYIFEGTFIYDIFFCTRFEEVTSFIGATYFEGYSVAHILHSIIRWGRVGQIIRIPYLFDYCHSIFKYRTIILVTLYVWLTAVLCVCLGSVALFFSCPWTRTNWNTSDQYRLPDCLEETWINKKFDTKSVVLVGIFNRWIAGLYYVCQVIFVIGYGDMLTLVENELYLLVFMMIFGFIITRCIMADISAADVDSDEMRLKYQETLVSFRMILTQERVDERIYTTVYNYVINKWNKSKGLHQEELFYDLHPNLEIELYVTIMGDTIRRCPLFRDMPENIIRAICQNLTIFYYIGGQRIVREGNHIFSMFIVKVGQIWVCDQGLRYVCTLGPSESIGEGSMVHLLPKSHNGISANDVELYCLTRAAYEKICFRYPIFEALLRNRMPKQRDLFMKKVAVRNREVKRWQRPKSLSWGKFQIRKSILVRQILSYSEPNIGERLEELRRYKNVKRRNWFRKIVGWGGEDQDLAFFYFIQVKLDKQGTIKSKCLIHPNCGFMKFFNKLFVLLCYLTTALGFYEFAFYTTAEVQRYLTEQGFNFSNFTSQMEIFLELFMYLHIILKFITPYERPEGSYCKEYTKIISNYFGSVTYFWFDLISCTPIHFFNLSAGSPWKALYLIRSLRLVPFYRALYEREDDLEVSTFKFRIKISLSSFFLIAHVLACVFYIISPCIIVVGSQYAVCPGSKEKQTWTGQLQEEEKFYDLESTLPWKWWLRSLYWVVTTISTTGFGDITAQNIEEMIVAILCVFCGAFILSIILSHFTAGKASRTRSHREYLYQVYILVMYLKTIGLSAFREKRVLKYFILLWDRCRGRSYDQIVQFLPPNLQVEVSYGLYYAILRKVRILGQTPSKIFFRQLCLRLSHMTYLPGDRIVNQGDQGSELFIVFKGSVAGYKINPNTNKITIEKLYNPGDIFGRSAAFFYDSMYSKNYRAEEVTEVLMLHQDDILYLAAHFPIFDLNCQVEIMTLFDPEEVSRCIFAVKKKPDTEDLNDDEIEDRIEKQIHEMFRPDQLKNTNRRLSPNIEAKIEDLKQRAARRRIQRGDRQSITQRGKTINKKKLQNLKIYHFNKGSKGKGTGVGGNDAKGKITRDRDKPGKPKVMARDGEVKEKMSEEKVPGIAMDVSPSKRALLVNNEKKPGTPGKNERRMSLRQNRDLHKDAYKY